MARVNFFKLPAEMQKAIGGALQGLSYALYGDQYNLTGAPDVNDDPDYSTVDLNNISGLSMIGAALCYQAGRDYLRGLMLDADPSKNGFKEKYGNNFTTETQILLLPPLLEVMKWIAARKRELG